MSRTPYIFLDGDSRLSSRPATKYFVSLLVLIGFFFIAVPFFQESKAETNRDYVEEVALPLPAYIEPGSVSPLFEAFYNCVRPKLAPLVGSYDEVDTFSKYIPS